MMQTLERPALNMNRLFAATPFGRTRKAILDASSERPDAQMTGIADLQNPGALEQESYALEQESWALEQDFGVWSESAGSLG